MTLTTCRPRYATLWDDFFNDFYAPIENREISPRTKVTDNGKSIRLEVELPGVKKDDIKVEVENGVLTIAASKKHEKKEEGKDIYFNEISYGEYKRSFRLSDEVEHGKVNAKFEDGTLSLELAKKEKAKPKLIDVK
jgi:HSP20 family protein